MKERRKEGRKEEERDFYLEGERDQKIEPKEAAKDVNG